VLELASLRDAIVKCDLQLLWLYAGDVNEPDLGGLTPLRMALLPMRAGCTLQHRLAVLDALSHKANFNIDKPSQRFTALTWAALDDPLKVDVLRWLVETGGADVNCADEHGSYAIHRAVESGLKSGDTRKIEYLLSLPHLDVRVRDSRAETALDIALRFHGSRWDAAARRVSEALQVKVRHFFFAATVQTLNTDAFSPCVAGFC
jgi:ankyrin repeat protein